MGKPSWIAIAGLVVFAGCGRQPAPRPTSSAAAAPRKSDGGTKAADRHGVLFQDDFSKPTGAWPQHQGDAFIAEHVGGRYRLWANQDERPYVSTEAWSGHDFTDVGIVVTATRVAGYEGNGVGLFCRESGDGGFSSYFADIDGEGEARLGKYVRGTQTILGEEDGAPLFAKGTRMLSLVCNGDRLSFSIDGTMILAAQDGELHHGDVGLSVGGAGHGQIDVLFDDFIVTAPKPGERNR